MTPNNELLLEEQVNAAVATGIPATMRAEAEEELQANAYSRREDGLTLGARIRQRFECYLARRLADRPEITPTAIRYAVTVLMTECVDRAEERLMTGAALQSEELGPPVVH